MHSDELRLLSCHPNSMLPIEVVRTVRARTKMASLMSRMESTSVNMSRR